MSEACQQPMLVKWGGSLITDKTRDQTLRRGRLDRLCRELADGRREGPLILGHGAGSFGHMAARRAGFNERPLDPAQVAGAAATRHQASRLHAEVLARLSTKSVPAFSWAPSSALVARAGRTSRGNYRPLELALDLGLVPVTFGDVVTDELWGASIHSTETVFLALTRALSRAGRVPRGVIWCGETNGVLDARGGRIDQIDASNVKALLGGLRGAAGPDVTGGIRHRVESAWRLAQLGIDSWIIDARKPGSLLRALQGRFDGATWVVGSR